MQCKSESYISTHTLTWSVTNSNLQTITTRTHFNSHAHVERDTFAYYFLLSLIISTHTLTWSVTHNKIIVKTWRQNFNSHAHVERDFTVRVLSISFDNFNSHAHVERDQTKKENLDLKNNFNSHAHVERDEKLKQAEDKPIISTHTLTWSVT